MKLSVTYRPQKCSISYKPQKVGMTIKGSVVKEYIDSEPYEGEYEVTPSQQTVVLATDGKRMVHDVVVNPIPSNWGQIEYDGAIMTIW